MNTFAALLGIALAVAGVRATFSEDDQSYIKTKRGLSVVPAPSLAPAAVPAQPYYATAALSPYFGFTRSAYLPTTHLLPRLAPAYYPATPATAYAPAYPAPAPAGTYPAPAPAAAYPAGTYAAPAPAAAAYPAGTYPAPAPAAAAYPAGVAYSATPAAHVARAPHPAYFYYG